MLKISPKYILNRFFLHFEITQNFTLKK